MRSFHTLHLPHFHHFSAHTALLSAQQRLGNYGTEITVALTVVFGILMMLTFWAVLAH